MQKFILHLTSQQGDKLSHPQAKQMCLTSSAVAAASHWALLKAVIRQMQSRHKYLSHKQLLSSNFLPGTKLDTMGIGDTSETDDCCSVAIQERNDVLYIQNHNAEQSTIFMSGTGNTVHALTEEEGVELENSFIYSIFTRCLPTMYQALVQY